MREERNVNTSKQLLSEVRRQLFFHLEGIPLTFVISELIRKGFFSYAAHTPKFDFHEARNFLQANKAYLKIALRLLCSLGWFYKSGTWEHPQFGLTEQGRRALELLPAYRNAAAALPAVLNMEATLSGENKAALETYQKLIQLSELNWRIDFTDQQKGPEPAERTIHQLKGLLAGPSMVFLARKNLLPTTHKPLVSNQSLQEAGLSQAGISALKSLFEQLDWLVSTSEGLKASEKGQMAFDRAFAYGVTVSYLPMFSMMSDLLFGDPLVLWKVPKGQPEIHVDRAMNVWGSGGAHTTYFKKIDEIVIDIFNQPIEQQPAGIADMGCGDGQLLIHLYNLIKNKTSRGSQLDQYPLHVVGIDFNEAALNSTKENLEKAGLPFKTTHGDIGNPDELSKNLKQQFDLELGDFLNVRSFLDHNRIYNAPKQKPNHGLESTSCFAFRGKALNNENVIQSLLEHFTKWVPHVKKHGLLVLELHGLDPLLVEANPGKTAMIAYEGTHGFSDQYILELPIFLETARLAGLQAIPEFQNQFPRSELACISINLFR